MSYHNGQIDWQKVKDAGIDFAIIRAGYGQNNIDKQAHYNALRCNEVGLHLGAYWFSYALNEAMAEKEADYFNTFLAYHKFDMPVYYDFEYASVTYMKKHNVVPSITRINQLACAFCRRMEMHGFYAGIYANADYVKNKYTKDTFDKYDLWLADWKENPSIIANLWQYTDKLTVPGIKGKVDGDIANLNFPSVIRKNKLNNL